MKQLAVILLYVLAGLAHGYGIVPGPVKQYYYTDSIDPTGVYYGKWPTPEQAVSSAFKGFFPDGIIDQITCDGIWVQYSSVEQMQCTIDWHFWACSNYDNPPCSWQFRSRAAVPDRWQDGVRCPDASDPGAAGECVCRAGYAPAEGQCLPSFARRAPKPPPACGSGGASPDPSFGKPIQPLRGVERHALDTRISIGGTTLQFTYDSSPISPLSTPTGEPAASGFPVLGIAWSSSLHRRLKIAPNQAAVRAVRGTGHEIVFTRNGVSFVAEADVADRLVHAGTELWYYDHRQQALEVYSTEGQLRRIAYADGRQLVFTYAPGVPVLDSVSDAFGRTIRFAYVPPAGSADAPLQTVFDANGRPYGLNYLNGNFSQLTWPDDSFVQLKYEDARHPLALTGLVDENAARHATVGYDASGRAVSTALAGGVSRYSAAYSYPPVIANSDAYDRVNGVVWQYGSWRAAQGLSLTLPNGTSSSLQSAASIGVPRLTSQSQPAGAGCGASSASQAYDANGNVSQSDDFNGIRVCMAYDLGRNLQTAKVEGLASTAVCSTVLAAATLPAGTRKTVTAWHPDWALPVKVAEPGRITTTVYHGQPDPWNGNAKANCAPSTALLPDKKPIAVVCKRVEQATSTVDPTGSQGFNAPPDTAVPLRVWTYSYNEFGQVLTSDGPRASGDTLDTMTYEYWPVTTFNGTDPAATGQTRGDLKRVVNALGQSTEYALYNKAGQVLESKDANGVVTTYRYDPRGRPLSVQVGSETTQYEHYPTGLLKKVIQPDGISFVQYQYNDAHQLIKASDQLGNSIDYQPDNFGNVTQELVRDAAQAQRRSLLRGIDPLGRVEKLTGRE